jgi:hypothetical protein
MLLFESVNGGLPRNGVTNGGVVVVVLDGAEVDFVVYVESCESEVQKHGTFGK